MPAPSILATGTIHRHDILRMFDSLRTRASLTFVEYGMLSPGFSDDVYDDYGRLIGWHDAGSVHRLLDRVNPELVVLLAHSSLNQVALMRAAAARRIPTLHVEHGFRLSGTTGYEMAYFDLERRLRVQPARLFNTDPARLQTHAFLRSLADLPWRDRLALAAYWGDGLAHGVSTAVLQRHASLRRPTAYASFSEECFAFHRSTDRLPADAPVVFTGVPMFDQFTLAREEAIDADDPENEEILLIDGQVHNGPALGWSSAARVEWVRELHDVIMAQGLRLAVRQHPQDKSDSWRPFLAGGRVRLVETEELPSLARRVRAVLGMFSTLQLPFAAQPHVAHITLENHPERPSRSDYPSKQFVDAGVAYPVFSSEELGAALLRRRTIASEQHSFKERFVKRFLHALDGQATERLSAAVMGMLKRA